MSSCGVCGGSISRTLTPHGAICEDDRKAQRFEPQLDDLIKMIEESEGPPA